MSLAELGRFTEAAKYEAEVIQIADSTEYAFSIGWAHFAASMPHLLKGDWAKARTLAEHWIVTLRTGNVAIHLPWAVAASAWALAQLGEVDQALERVNEAEELLERQTARGIVGHRGWAYHAGGRSPLWLSAGLTRHDNWPSARQALHSTSRASQLTRSICSAISHSSPTDSIRKTARRTAGRLWHLHKSTVCARSSPTAILVSAKSTAASARRRPTKISLLRRQCTPKWTWASGSSRQKAAKIIFADGGRRWRAARDDYSAGNVDPRDSLGSRHVALPPKADIGYAD
jgi:hypothetical protein